MTIAEPMKDFTQKIFRSFRNANDEERAAKGFKPASYYMSERLVPPEVLPGEHHFLVAVDKTWDQLTAHEQEKIRQEHNQIGE